MHVCFQLASWPLGAGFVHDIQVVGNFFKNNHADSAKTTLPVTGNEFLLCPCLSACLPAFLRVCLFPVCISLRHCIFRFSAERPPERVNRSKNTPIFENRTSQASCVSSGPCNREKVAE